MATYAITRYETLSSVVNQICQKIGFPASADPAGSTDPVIIKIIAAVNDAATDMLNMYPWQEMQRQGTLSVVASVPGESERSFDLPDDYFGFVDQTQNDASVRRPVWNPLTALDWQSIKNLTPIVTFELMWRVRENKIWFLSPPTAAHTFTYEYISQGWCTDADNPTLYKNEATKNGDTFLLDGYLISLLGRAKFQESSGFDSMFAQRDFMRAFDNRVGQSAGAPMLNIAGGAFAPFRLINGMNAPQTGYGS